MCGEGPAPPPALILSIISSRVRRRFGLGSPSATKASQHFVSKALVEDQKPDIPNPGGARGWVTLHWEGVLGVTAHGDNPPLPQPVWAITGMEVSCLRG